MYNRINPVIFISAINVSLNVCFYRNKYILNKSKQSSLIILLLIGVIFNSMRGNAQSSKTDSLEQLITTAIPDTQKVAIMVELTGKFSMSDPVKGLAYGEKAIDLSTQIKYPKGLANAYNNTALVYMNKGEYAKALNLYLKSLKIREQIKDEKGVATSLNNIGVVYWEQNNTDKALYYYNLSLNIREKINDSAGTAMSLNNIASVFGSKAEYEKALSYYFQVIKVREALRDKRGLALTYNNIGASYQEMKKSEKALEYIFKSLALRKEIGDITGTVVCLNNIGNIYNTLGDYKKAIEYHESGLKTASRLDSKDDMKEAYAGLSDAYAGLKEFGQAYNYLQQYGNMKDSLLNEENSRQINEMEALYQTEKKENEIKLLTKEQQVQKLEIKKKKITIYFFALGSGLIILLSMLIFKSYRNKRKAHNLLETKNKIIEEKNKDITDSINYAKNIQQAILPFDYRIRASLNEHFVLFKPRDIVSGDFYWYTEKDNYIFIATADCTGHGVPGAFMSMIGSATLTHAVNERGITEPGKILSESSRKIKEALKQSENNNRDGMDISLLRFEKNKLNKVQFAGAMHTLYHINEQLNEIKGDKMPIGGTTDNEFQYNTHELKLQKGDMLYISTDGYSDQFGGKDGKKFRTGNFKKLLVSIKDKSMSEQKKMLDETYETWKGNLEQVDDVCVIGIKI